MLLQSIITGKIQTLHSQSGRQAKWMTTKAASTLTRGISYITYERTIEFKKSEAEVISNLGVALRSTDLILHGPGASAERYGKREDVPTILVILSDNPSDDLFQKERDRLSQSGFHNDVPI